MQGKIKTLMVMVLFVLSVLVTGCGGESAGNTLKVMLGSNIVSLDSAQMTDEAGFLLPGIIGRQEELAEAYINIGSLYLCTAAFLPLGLAPQDPFWADEDAAWTGKLIWEGRPSRIDHALD